MELQWNLGKQSGQCEEWQQQATSGSGQVHTRLPRWMGGQGVSQQSPGQLEPGQVRPAPRQGPQTPHLDFPVLSLPRSPGGP